MATTRTKWVMLWVGLAVFLALIIVGVVALAAGGGPARAAATSQATERRSGPVWLPSGLLAVDPRRVAGNVDLAMVIAWAASRNSLPRGRRLPSLVGRDPADRAIVVVVGGRVRGFRDARRLPPYLSGQGLPQGRP